MLFDSIECIGLPNKQSESESESVISYCHFSSLRKMVPKRKKIHDKSFIFQVNKKEKEKQQQRKKLNHRK